MKRGGSWIGVRETLTFERSGTTFKVLRVEFYRGGKPVTRFEVYRVEPDGLETFLGYNRKEWLCRVPCGTCGAAAHTSCRSVGKLTTLGRPMMLVHAARRRVAGEG